MIATLRGTVLETDGAHVVLEAAGVGYEVSVTPHTSGRLPPPGGEALLYIAESMALYGGGTTLYGFLSREEKSLFSAFRDLPGVGAKKALESLDKASRSLPEFRRAVASGDTAALVKVFGFSRKTAEKLVSGLKDELGPASSAAAPVLPESPLPETGPLARALEALAALGYRPAEARLALDGIRRDLAGREAPVEELLRLALRRL